MKRKFQRARRHLLVIIMGKKPRKNSDEWCRWSCDSFNMYGYTILVGSRNSSKTGWLLKPTLPLRRQLHMVVCTSLFHTTMRVVYLALRMIGYRAPSLLRAVNHINQYTHVLDGKAASNNSNSNKGKKGEKQDANHDVVSSKVCI